MNPVQQTKALIQKVFGTRFSRELKRIQPLVNQVHEHERRLKELPDAAIQISHENHCGNLLNQGAITSFQIRRVKLEERP